MVEHQKIKVVFEDIEGGWIRAHCACGWISDLCDEIEDAARLFAHHRISRDLGGCEL